MSQCTVIFLNQLRSKVGVIYGSPEVTSGGNALKFYSSVRLDTRRKEILPDNMGIRIKVKVVKNKVAAPFKVVNLDILFGTGIDRIGNILDCAYDLNIVQRKGSWFSYKSENLAQGRHKAVQLLKQDLDLQHQLQTEVRLALADLGNNEEDSNESSSPSAAAKTTNNTNKSQQTSSAATVVESLDGLESSSGPAPFE
mmetsp:Transcript_13332/g.14604  ORF Transcript_13332/g.14604 Transcript_13332/m.14604 type:complete len:197 (-) Transcript_13332:155-745(-)